MFWSPNLILLPRLSLTPSRERQMIKKVCGGLEDRIPNKWSMTNTIRFYIDSGTHPHIFILWWFVMKDIGNRIWIYKIRILFEP